MPPTLEDIIALPTNPGPEHLSALGLLRPPIPPVMNVAPTAVAPMSPVVPKPLGPYDPAKPMHSVNTGRDADLSIGATTQPILPRLGPHPNPVAPMIAPKLDAPAPIPSAAAVPAMPSGPAATAQPVPSAVAPMAKPNVGDAWKTGHSDLELAEGGATAPAKFPSLSPVNPAGVSAPDLETGLTAGEGIATAGPKAPTAKESIAAGIAEHGGTEKEEGKRQFQELRPPVTAEPGSAEYDRQKLAQMDFDKAHPWGNDISAHPGLLGKLGHVAAKVGNTALDVAAPGVALNIPGTDMNKRMTENATKQHLAGAEERETAADTEATREKHEENTEDVNQRKLDQVEEKIDETAHKNETTRQRDLRKAGLKPDPENPDGPPIPVTIDDMSETEKDVHNLKTAQAEAQGAKAELDKVRADPNSPQSKAALARIRVMAKNAETAAGKLGLDKEKFVADYFGLDKDGNPLPGADTDANGKPIGPRVGNANKVTNASRTMAEMARSVREQIPPIKKQIDDLAGSLGPAAGRWNELMVNKGGTDYPQFAGLDTDLDLLASAIVRTHFGARGGQGYREELRKQFGEAQSPEDLKARIDHADEWLRGYANLDKKGGAKSAPATPPPAPPMFEKGATRTNKKTGEEQTYDGKTWQTTKPGKQAAPAQ